MIVVTLVIVWGFAVDVSVPTLEVIEVVTVGSVTTDVSVTVEETT